MISCTAMLLCLTSASVAQGPSSDEPPSVGEVLSRAHRLTRAWLALTPDAPLITENEKRQLWTPHNAAADVYPFLVLTAHYTDRSLLEPLEAMLAAEQRLAWRPNGLPDAWGLAAGQFHSPEANTGRQIFGASEYCKDGLLPIVELLGEGPWLDHLEALATRVCELSSVPTAYGPIPADSAEICGEMLQVLSRLYAATGKGKYLEAAERVGDAWLLEVLPRSNGLPCHRWDFDEHRPREDVLSLNDHGNEIVAGLLELYAVTTTADPDRARRYEPAVRRMVGQLLATARREDGLWAGKIKPSTGEVLAAGAPDTWGYALSAVYTMHLLTGDEQYRTATLRAMRGAADVPSWRGADSLADAIEGALILLSREPMPELGDRASSWVRATCRAQRESGLVEGWHGDGNSARTWLLYARWRSQGIIAQPWRDGLEYSARQRGGGLIVEVAPGRDAWSGRLHFDTPRHREFWRLPVDYPRLNESPQWFVVEGERHYEVSVNGEAVGDRTGAQLSAGLSLRVAGGQTATVRIRPADHR